MEEFWPQTSEMFFYPLRFCVEIQKTEPSLTLPLVNRTHSAGTVMLS